MLPDNEDAWDFLCQFPGVLATNGMSPALRVDYAAVRELAAEIGIESKTELIAKLEAIARGYNSKS